MPKIELSNAQCESVVDLIETNLLDIIRADTDIDNLNWLRNIMQVLEKLEAAVKGETAEEAEKSEWISTKDRLPETGDAVFVIANGRPKPNIELHDACLIAAYYPDEGWIVDGHEGWDRVDVSFWVPLPEPPKDGNA